MSTLCFSPFNMGSLIVTRCECTGNHCVLGIVVNIVVVLVEVSWSVLCNNLSHKIYVQGITGCVLVYFLGCNIM